MQPEIFSPKISEIDLQMSAGKIIGLKVIASNGIVIGTVDELRLDENSKKVEGIVVNRKFSLSKVFISRDYIENISQSAVMLDIVPSFLYKNKKVLSANGKVVGVAREIVRRSQSNEITKIVVKSMFRKDMEIPSSAVERFGKIIVLKNSYNVKPKYFWQKS